MPQSKVSSLNSRLGPLAAFSSVQVMLFKNNAGKDEIQRYTKITRDWPNPAEDKIISRKPGLQQYIGKALRSGFGVCQVQLSAIASSLNYSNERRDSPMVGSSRSTVEQSIQWMRPKSSRGRTSLAGLVSLLQHTIVLTMLTVPDLYLTKQVPRAADTTRRLCLPTPMS